MLDPKLFSKDRSQLKGTIYEGLGEPWETLAVARYPCLKGALVIMTGFFFWDIYLMVTIDPA